MGLEYKLHNQNIINRSGNSGKVYTKCDDIIYVAGQFDKTDPGVVAMPGILRLQSDGEFDSSFDVGIGGPSRNGSNLHIQSDNKILTAGTSFNNTSSRDLIRLTTSGTLDSTFANDTIIANLIHKITTDSNNKILIGGDFTTVLSTTANRIARLNSSGSTLDASFNTGTGFNGIVREIIIDNSGNIIAGGDFTSYNGTSINRLARITSTGSLDTSFNIGSGFNNSVQTIDIDDNNKILVGGSFTSFNGNTRNRIIRINSDGSDDTTNFNNGTGFNGTVYKIKHQNDKILVGSESSSYNGTTELNYLIRLTSSGTIDNSFNAPASETVIDFSLQSNGNIVYLTTNANDYFNIVSSNGSQVKDTSISIESDFGLLGRNQSLGIDSNDKIIITGSTTKAYLKNAANTRILSLNGDGTINSVFGLVTTDISYPQPHSMFIDSNNKLVIGAYYKNKVYRYNSDGSVDSSLDMPVDSVSSGPIWCTSAYSNNKILIGGDFTSYKAVSCGANLIRVDSTGTIDSTFDTGTGFNDTVYTITVQSDNKILVGGEFNEFNSVAQSGLIRLTESGTKDSSFDIGSGFDYFSSRYIYSIKIQNDNKILVGGYFNTYKGITQRHIVRLNTDGTKDSSFNVGEFNSGITDICIQEDNKIVVVGGFTSYNGSTYNKIIRLNSDGSVDTSFNIGFGFQSYNPSKIDMLSNGKFVITGNMTGYNTTLINYFVVLNRDGSVDQNFRFDLNDISYGLAIKR